MPVAKHGNRSATSRSGSADVLEALGARIDLAPEAVGACIERAGFGFMFAPAHHPALRHIVPVRRALGVRTIFNLLGPLTNPAGVRRQVIGVSDPAYLERLGEALAALGVDHALVVAARDGMDEISTEAPTDVVEVRPEGLRQWRIDPAEFGIAAPAPGGDRGRRAGRQRRGRHGGPRGEAGRSGRPRRAQRRRGDLRIGRGGVAGRGVRGGP